MGLGCSCVGVDTGDPPVRTWTSELPSIVRGWFLRELLRLTSGLLAWSMLLIPASCRLLPPALLRSPPSGVGVPAMFGLGPERESARGLSGVAVDGMECRPCP